MTPKYNLDSKSVIIIFMTDDNVKSTPRIEYKKTLYQMVAKQTEIL